MSLNRTQAVDWLYRCGDVFTKESDFLAGFNKEIDDADHGLNMYHGFNKMVEKLPSVADKGIDFVLKSTGMTLLSNVGGASGPLFGTFPVRAAQITQAHQSLALNELYLMIHKGADGVVNRGKAEPGDKVMCDVWLPVASSLHQSSEQHLSIAAALDAVCEVAERTAHATITMQAREGRTSCLGEHSIGHQGPGTTSVLLVVQMLAATAKE